MICTRVREVGPTLVFFFLRSAWTRCTACGGSDPWGTLIAKQWHTVFRNLWSTTVGCGVNVPPSELERVMAPLLASPGTSPDNRFHHMAEHRVIAGPGVVSEAQKCANGATQGGRVGFDVSYKSHDAARIGAAAARCFLEP